MTAKTYLVTGGAGFIGAAMVRRLLVDGHGVRVLARCPLEKATRLAGVQSEIEFFEADVRDGAAVVNAAKGVDGILHFAAITATDKFYETPDQVLDVGVKGMLAVVDACMKHGIGELVLTSSSEAYQTPAKVPTDETEPLAVPNPLNPRYSYAASKIISELMAINFGRKHFDRVLICRPHNVYGPDMGWSHVLPHFVMRMKRLAAEVLDGPIRFPIQGTGRETRAFEYIDDFVDGAMVMMEKGEHLGIYHIGTDEETAIADAARMVGDFYGRAVDIEPSPAPEGGTPRRCPDISKLRALGYAPRFTLAQGLPVIAGWYDENAGDAPETQ
jgi:nucleoside-diphosphate-sugar epimerase